VTAVQIERDGDVLRVELARPEVRNALDFALIAELAAAFAEVGDARVVLLSGDGPSFCAGADLERIGLSFEQILAESEALRALLTAIDTCPVPVVCRVQGHALGGGAGLVACSDIAIAAEDAVFGFPEVKLGVVPAVISPFVLARIGSGPARRYFLTGERFAAATALRIGLVQDVVDDLDGTVERILAELIAAGPEAVRAAKRLVLDPPDGPESARRAAQRWTSAEGQAGVRAFRERRRPDWAS
jgi:methylglutaconyl-CoA hydratase